MSVFKLGDLFASRRLRQRQRDLEGQLAAINKSQAVIEFRLDGTILHANDNFLTAVGYSLDEIVGQHHRLFVTPAERESTEYRLFWEKLGRGEYDAGQYKRVGKGGREIWIQASYNPVFDDSGKAYKVVKYASDITQQTRQMADFTGQMDAISKSQAVIEFELDGIIRHANPNFLGAVGYELSEIVGQHHRIFVTEAERNSPEYKQFWAQLGQGEYDAGQYKRVRKDGSEIWIQASYNPILDPEGKPFKVVKYASDITAEVRAREVMEEAIGRTQGTMQAVAEGQLAERIDMAGLSGDMEKLCASLNRFLEANEQSAVELEAQREREAKVAAENLRIRIALDNAGTNVMIADNDRTVRYANRAVMQMLADAESDIRKDLPQFRADGVLNGSIDQFHKNPEHQKRMLEGLKSRHQAQIKVGGRTFGLAVNPVVSESGERLGTVVEWDDRTAELAVESEIAGIVEAAANGDFSQRIEADGKGGFFQKLAEGINRVLDTSEVGLQDIARVLGELAQGNLTSRIDADYQGMFGQLKNDVNSTIDNLTEIVQAIKASAEVITTASREIAAGNADLSSRTEQQAASLEETASSMEQFTSTVKQNAENARQANQLTLGASDVATQGGEVVGQVVTTMDEIATSSKKVEDIIGVIDGIAFQTNILALNAAVEAARAGEQGRGFAVVAGEVRSLAQRSSAAAKEIKALINESVHRVENGTSLVQRAGETMQEIVTSVKRVADIMAEITAASEEQSSGIEQVNQTVSQMDEVTQQNAALVEEASASAQSLDDQTGTLMQAVGAFVLNAQAGQALPPARSAEPVARVQHAQMPKGVPVKVHHGPARNGATRNGRHANGNGHAVPVPPLSLGETGESGSDHWEEF